MGKPAASRMSKQEENKHITPNNHSQSDTVSQHLMMKESLLELDPDADALLILQRPNLKQVRPYLDDAFLIPGEEVQDNKKVESTTTASPEADGIATITKATALKDITSLSPEQTDGTPNEIVFRVSAIHLSMVSPVFRKLIKGNSRESKPNDQGLLKIRISDWNAGALLVLLDIIHGHHSHVPERLSQEHVAHMGLIADYYDCSDIVQVFYRGWEARFVEYWDYSWPDIENQSLDSFGKKEQFQLFIAWTFQSDQVFGHLATNAILTSTGPIETYLPIPSIIIDKLEERRIGLLDQLFDLLYNLQENLLEGSVGCCQECSCRLAGHLMRQMWDWNLPMTKPEEPFLGFSVSSVGEAILAIETPPWKNHKQVKIVDRCKLEKDLDFDMVEMYQSISSFTMKEIGMKETGMD